MSDNTSFTIIVALGLISITTITITNMITNHRLKNTAIKEFVRNGMLNSSQNGESTIEIK